MAQSRTKKQSKAKAKKAAKSANAKLTPPIDLMQEKVTRLGEKVSEVVEKHNKVVEKHNNLNSQIQELIGANNELHRGIIDTQMRLNSTWNLTQVLTSIIQDELEWSDELMTNKIKEKMTALRLKAEAEYKKNVEEKKDALLKMAKAPEGSETAEKTGEPTSEQGEIEDEAPATVALNNEFDARGHREIGKVADDEKTEADDETETEG